jgi:hypothetical protein
MKYSIFFFLLLSAARPQEGWILEYSDTSADENQ